MILTEEEAKSELCIGPANCGEIVGEHRYCVASACKMAWRQRPPKTRYCRGISFTVYPASTDAPLEGYCGLAGKPE